jgi:hypothetical protein
VRRLVLQLVIVAALISAGCSEPPQKEIDAAQTAVDAAKAVGAEGYAAEEYSAAVTALQKSRDSVTQRDYRQALNYAIDARQRADESAKQTATAKAHTRVAAETLVTECSARVSQLDTDIRVAEGMHVPARDLKSMQTTHADAETALQEARSSIGTGNYAEVVTSLTEVRRKLDAAIAAVDALRQRPPRRRR